jgi:hypothetical protein
MRRVPTRRHSEANGGSPGGDRHLDVGCDAQRAGRLVLVRVSTRIAAYLHEFHNSNTKILSLRRIRGTRAHAFKRVRRMRGATLIWWRIMVGDCGLCEVIMRRYNQRLYQLQREFHGAVGEQTDLSARVGWSRPMEILASRIHRAMWKIFSSLI